MSISVSPTLLVVDTSTPIVHHDHSRIVAILSQRKFAICRADSYGEAIQLATDQPLDLIICDSAVLGRDHANINLISELHALPDRSDVPVLFTSATQKPDVMLRNHPWGAAFHVKTPVESRVLLDLVDKSLWMPHLIRTHVRQRSLAGPHYAAKSATVKNREVKNPSTQPAAKVIFPHVGGFETTSAWTPVAPVVSR